MKNASPEFTSNSNHFRTYNNADILSHQKSVASSSSEQAFVHPIESQYSKSGLVCDTCHVCHRIAALLEQQRAPEDLVEDVKSLIQDMCGVKDNVYLALDEMTEYVQRIESYVKDRCESNSLTQVFYPVAQAMVKWQDTIRGLLSASDDLSTMAMLLNEEMVALEQADGNNREVCTAAANSTSETNPIPVTMWALAKRINRILRKERQTLHKSRGLVEKSNLGEWYVLYDRNTIVSWQIDLERYGRENKCLAPHEYLAE